MKRYEKMRKDRPRRDLKLSQGDEVGQGPHLLLEHHSKSSPHLAAVLWWEENGSIP